MLFKPEHIAWILQGKKVATRRIWHKPRVKVGNIYKCKTKMLSKDSFATIKVTKLYHQSLREMTDDDYKKEGYQDYISFRNAWERINGEWIPSLIITVIEFELAKQEASADSSQA